MALTSTDECSFALDLFLFERLFNLFFLLIISVTASDLVVFGLAITSAWLVSLLVHYSYIGILKVNFRIIN